MDFRRKTIRRHETALKVTKLRTIRVIREGLVQQAVQLEIEDGVRRDTANQG